MRRKISIKRIGQLLEPVFRKYNVKLAYLFGSYATGDIGPLSDFDIAVYLKKKNQDKLFYSENMLIADIGEKLKTDNIDIVFLHKLQKPELKYHIIKDGIIIYERESYRVMFEPQTLNEYFDFYSLLKRHNLTKA